MGKKNFYAIRHGRETGIFRSWEECKAKVSGCAGAEFKGFETLEEAESYMKKTGDREETLPRDCVKIYVDGSYCEGEFSYGMVVLRDEKEYTFSKKVEDASLAAMHNVAGEIKGAQAAMEYALENSIKEIAIFYDYAGIEKWCTGEWQAKQQGTQAYRDLYNQVRDKIKVHFIKVKGHSNDKYNDMADELAKKALGI